MANSVDPDETAHCEPSHLDLHCLHKGLCRTEGINETSNEYQFSVAREVLRLLKTMHELLAFD